MAASAYFEAVQKIYIAFYQRPADPAGLKYWATEIDKAGGDLTAAIVAFGTSAEAQELYGDIDLDTIEGVIDSIYFAAFGRYPETEGLEYWVGEFAAGRVTASGIALAVVMGAQNEDLAYIDNKLVVADQFTALVDGRDLTDPAFGTAPFAATYEGDDDAQTARDLLSGVTDDPDSIPTAEDILTTIVDYIADEGDAIIPQEPAPTFTLTADVDSADEGDTVIFTVEGGQPNFTYTFELTGVNAADVEGGALTGTVTTDADGNGTFEVTLIADRATEGEETLVATLPNTGLSASVTVNDTSLDNIAPVAVNATAEAIEDGAVVTGQLEATDADDDALTFTLDAPLQGLTLNADGSYSFDPTQNDIVKALTTAGGPVDLVANYTVTDALGATATGTLTITAAPAPLSFKLEAGAATVNEDGTITFTVTASEAVEAATDVVFTLVPGNGSAPNQGTDTTNLNDFSQGAFNPVTVKIPAGGTTATFTVTPPDDDVTELAESFSVQAVVGGQTLTATATLLDGSVDGGKTFTLTTGTDNFSPTATIGANKTTSGNDTFEATGKTFTALDSIDGGAGTDKIIIKDADGVMNAAAPSGITLKSVESMEIQTSGSLGVAAVTGQTAQAAVKAVDTYTIADAPLSYITFTGAFADGDTLSVDADGIGAVAATTLSYTDADGWSIGATRYPSLAEAVVAAVNAQSGTAAAFVSNGTVYTQADLAAWTFTPSGSVTVDATQKVNDALIEGAKFSITYGGVTLQTAALDSTPTKAEAQTLIAGVINGIAGTTVATVAGDNLVITAPVAGVDLPSDIAITYWANGTNATNNPTAIAVAITPASSVANQEARDAITAVAAAPYDVSGFTDLADVAVTSSNGMALKAAATQNVTVSGSTGTITVEGGKDVTVNDATADKAITIGATTAPAGAITVTDTNQGTGTIKVDGGTTVTVTATSTVDNGTITIGAAKAATGAVSVTTNLNGDGTAALDQGDITVTGGSTVTVNSNLTITAKDQTAGNTHSFGDVAVTGDGKTTSVTVNQTYSETEFTKPGVATVNELHTVTFLALNAGQTTTVDGLTFTASKTLTAAEVAQAFSNLTASDLQSSGGKTANGLFSGQLSGNFTSGAANGAVVVFTAQDEDETLDVTAGDVDPSETVVDGTAAVTEVESNNSATYGKVTVVDNATAAIKTITLDGYGAGSTIGGVGTETEVLDTLTLKNGTNITVADTADTLTLNLENVEASGAGVVFTSGPTTLNVNSIGDNHAHLVLNGTTTLNVGGTGTLRTEDGMVTGTLTTVKVTESAGLTLDEDLDSSLTSVDTTGTTGTVTVSIDGTKATYAGGAGVDDVTLTTANPTKAINLGAGDDFLNLLGGTSTSTAVIEGGDGTDTLEMTAADAEANSATATFETKINGFERLTIGDAASQEVVNLANLDDINYVTLGASTVAAAQVNTITVSGTIEVGDVFTATVNGATYSFTATTTAIADVVTGLRNAVNTGAPAGITVGTAGATSFTLTAAVAGVPFTASVATTDGGTDGTQTLDIATATANAADGITLNNLANNGTVVLTDTGSVIVGITDAATGTADALNVVASGTGDLGLVTADGVETINVTSSGGNLLLVGNAVTKVTVSGESAIALTTSAATLQEVDASTLSDVLTFTASVNNMVVKGGSDADVLMANANDVALYGGAGNDTLTVAGGLRVNLYGGDGADTFVINAGASRTLDAYTVINGVTSGDVIELGGATAFKSTKVALSTGADQTLLNYANQAANTLAAGEMGWFQKDGNTFIVLDQGTDSTSGFVADEDMIIMITGSVNLDTGASYNVTNNTLEII